MSTENDPIGRALADLPAPTLKSEVSERVLALAHRHLQPTGTAAVAAPVLGHVLVPVLLASAAMASGIETVAAARRIYSSTNGTSDSTG